MRYIVTSDIVTSVVYCRYIYMNYFELTILLLKIFRQLVNEPVHLTVHLHVTLKLKYFLHFLWSFLLENIDFQVSGDIVFVGLLQKDLLVCFQGYV